MIMSTETYPPHGACGHGQHEFGCDNGAVAEVIVSKDSMWSHRAYGDNVFAHFRGLFVANGICQASCSACFAAWQQRQNRWM